MRGPRPAPWRRCSRRPNPEPIPLCSRSAVFEIKKQHAPWYYSSSLGLEEFQEPFERDLRPLGPVVELVANLVDGLVQEVGVQQDPELRRRLRQQRGGGDGREIAFEERRAHRAVPEPRPRLQGGNVFRTRPGHRAEQGRVRRVVEGSQHSRDIPKGGALEPPDAEGPGRLALEVDDDQVLARVEDLPETVIPMATEVNRGDLPIAKQPEPVLRLSLELQDLSRFFPNGRGQPGQSLAED